MTPQECHEAVTPDWADGDEMPCNADAIAMRLDEEGGMYPVCTDHARAPMAPLVRPGGRPAQGTDTQLAKALMPLADAPDIENVPVSNWMHTLSQTVMEMHYELRRIGERLGGITGSGAQNAPQGSASPLPGIPGGPEGATGAPGGAGEVGLGVALRAIIPATYTDDGYFGVTALEIGEFAERADVLQRRAAEAAAAEDRAFEAETAIERVRARLRQGRDPSTAHSETWRLAYAAALRDVRAALDGTQ